MTNPTFTQLLKNPVHFFAFGFGSGLAPKAPGTVGTLAAIPIYWLIQDLAWGIYLSWLIVTFALGVYWCDRSSKLLQLKDPGGIVWDEFVGFWITMFLAPPGLVWILVGFIAFRFFDILKPWPISWLDRRVEGGFGIMIDDVLAGIYAFGVVQLVAFFYPRF